MCRLPDEKGPRPAVSMVSAPAFVGWRARRGEFARSPVSMANRGLEAGR